MNGPTGLAVTSCELTSTNPVTFESVIEWEGGLFQYFELQNREGGPEGPWMVISDHIIEWSYVDNPTTNVRTEYRVRGYAEDLGWSDWSSIAYHELWYSSASDTADIFDETAQTGDGADFSDIFNYAVITDSVTDTPTYYESVSDTAMASDLVMDTVIEKLRVGRFIGSNNGELFLYGHDYHGDGGDTMPAWWESKDIDMDDQFPQYIGKYKFLHTVKLRYIDMDEHDVIISVSTDGGVSWATNAKTIGTGSGGPKEKLFNFFVHGRTFMVRVAHSSADKDFQWVDMELMFEPAGDYFEVA